jgi:hypothetical protein
MTGRGEVSRTPAIQIFRFADDGRIVESRAVRDDLGTLRQLGHVPPLGPETGATRNQNEERSRNCTD